MDPEFFLNMLSKPNTSHTKELYMFYRKFALMKHIFWVCKRKGFKEPVGLPSAPCFWFTFPSHAAALSNFFNGKHRGLSIRKFQIVPYIYKKLNLNYKQYNLEISDMLVDLLICGLTKVLDGRNAKII